MTNEQMWAQLETFRTILKLSKDKEQVEAEIDRIMEATRTNVSMAGAQVMTDKQWEGILLMVRSMAEMCESTEQMVR